MMLLPLDLVPLNWEAEEEAEEEEEEELWGCCKLGKK